MRPPVDIEAIEAMTPAVMASGHRIFQTHRYSADDREHVAKLLEVMAPRPDAVVLDAGCGIGEVARIMAQMRPDLAFFLANISALQLSLCPDGAEFLSLHCDFHELPLPDGCVAAVMFSSALPQMDEKVALAQAFRVLIPGGVLLVNEPIRIEGDGIELEQRCACRTLTAEGMIFAIERAGFDVQSHVFPESNDAHFRALLVADGMGHLADTIRPLIVRAIKP